VTKKGRHRKQIGHTTFQEWPHAAGILLDFGRGSSFPEGKAGASCRTRKFRGGRRGADGDGESGFEVARASVSFECLPSEERVSAVGRAGKILKFKKLPGELTTD